MHLYIQSLVLAIDGYDWLLMRLCFVASIFVSLSQWTSEPYESIDVTYSNAGIAAKDGTQSGDCSQGLDKTQEDSASASTAPEATEQRTV